MNSHGAVRPEKRDSPVVNISVWPARWAETPVREEVSKRGLDDWIDRTQRSRQLAPWNAATCLTRRLASMKRAVQRKVGFEAPALPADCFELPLLARFSVTLAGPRAL